MKALRCKPAMLVVAFLAQNVGSTAVAASQDAANTAPPVRLAQQGRWLVDPQGRVVMLHGGCTRLSLDD